MFRLQTELGTEIELQKHVELQSHAPGPLRVRSAKNEWLNLSPPPAWEPIVNIKGQPGHWPWSPHPMCGPPWSAEWYVTWSNNGPVSLSCPSFYKPSIKPQQGRDKPWPTIMVFRVQSTAFLSFYGALLMLPLHWHYIFLMSRKIKLKYVKSTALLGNIKPGRLLVCCNKVWFLRLRV